MRGKLEFQRTYSCSGKRIRRRTGGSASRSEGFCAVGSSHGRLSALEDALWLQPRALSAIYGQHPSPGKKLMVYQVIQS